jgi:hypothetical protein
MGVFTAKVLAFPALELMHNEVAPIQMLTLPWMMFSNILISCQEKATSKLHSV